LGSFAYVAVDKTGKQKKGSMEAANTEKVKYLLRSEGMIPLNVTEQSILTKDINISIGASVNSRDLSVFCRQFASMIQAGITIIDTLGMLSDQVENKTLRKAIKEVKINIEKGETLSDSLRIHNKVFPSILINMVEAGEISGNLEISLKRMAEHFEKDAKLRSMIKKTMIYPIIVSIVAVGVIIVMLTIVIPSFSSMFETLGTDMPAITLAVISASNFLRSYWFIVLGVLFVIIAGFIYYKNTSYGKLFLGKITLRIPLLGKLIVKTYSSRFARTMSTLTSAGISTIDAMEMTAKTIDNALFKNALNEAKAEIERGVPLSIPIKECGLFPPMVFHMIRIGEETGNVEEMLHKLADYYDEEVEIATQSFMAALEPIIIVVLALIVGLLIISVMAPMLSMYGGLDNL
jgi:type IV pilus assembly protein PilC